MTQRIAQLLAMPPEWLEICAGAEAVLFGVGWGLAHLVMGRAPLGSPYGALDELPLLLQILLVVVAIVGGLTTIGAAWVNEARLRYCACSAIAVTAAIIALYVGVHVGYGPTISIYSMLVVQPVLAMLLLRRSGHVRA